MERITIRSKWGVPLLIAVAIAAAYSAGLRGPFVFDDAGGITDNATLRCGWRIWEVFVPPVGGYTVSGRPLANATLAINYAISGERTWSYHGFNVAVHIVAALLLFGLVRRIWRRPGAALAVALLWGVHPLNTEAVSYVVQRVESLMGMFYLLTLYALVRWVGDQERRWMWVSVAACWLGAGAKEVIAMAPLTAFLLDRAFLAGTFAEAWGRRRRYYLLLAGTWIILALLLAAGGGNRGGTVGLGTGVSVWKYGLTQFPAIVTYVRLALWPHPLVFEYGRFWVLGLGQVAWQAALVAGLLVGTVVALVRWPKVGFLMATFFLILAPTSLMPGTMQMIVEHRMYLPLILVVAGVVAIGVKLPRDIGLAALSAAVIAEGGATWSRNRVYRSGMTLWGDTAAKRPQNPVALCDYGVALFADGRTRDAIACYREALRIDPDNGSAMYDLGNALAQTGEVPEALKVYDEAIATRPDDAPGRCNYGNALVLAGRVGEAVDQLKESIRLRPGSARAHNDLGLALAAEGMTASAVEEYGRAEALRPDDPEIAYNRGAALAQAGRLAEAEREDRRAIQLKPGLAPALNNLGNALARGGRARDAIPQFEAAIRAGPGYWQAHFNLGNAELELGEKAKAEEQFREVLRLHPGFAPAEQMSP